MRSFIFIAVSELFAVSRKGLGLEDSVVQINSFVYETNFTIIITYTKIFELTIKFNYIQITKVQCGQFFASKKKYRYICTCTHIEENN